MVDITRPLEQMGTVTREIVQPEVTGRDVKRALHAQNAIKGNPLENIARVVGAVSSAIQGIASGIDGAGSDLSRDDGIQAGLASVTRDANGQLQIQPHATALFGGGLLPGLGGGGGRGGSTSTSAYESAALQGTLARGSLEVDTDINKIRTAHIGDPEGFKKESVDYLTGLAHRIQGSGVAGGLALHAQERIGQNYDNMVTQKAAQDIKSSYESIELRIGSDTNDAYNLALKGGMTSPAGSASNQAFLRSHAAAVAGIQSLGDNRVFGFTPEKIAARQHELSIQMYDADNQGKIDAAYKSIGATEAARRSDERVNAVQSISQAERQQLAANAHARIAFNSGQFADRVARNRQSLTVLREGVESGKIAAGEAGPLIGVIIKEAGQTGDPETAGDAHTWGALRHLLPSATGLTPSQVDRVLGVPSAAGGTNTVTSQQPAPQYPPAPVGGEFNYKSYAAGVKAIESHGDPNAVSPTGYRGLYQFGPAEWAKYGSKYGTITNPAAQEKAMFDYSADHYRQLVVSLGREPTASEMYLAHQQGVGGATALLTHPNTPAGELVPASHIRANGGDPRAPASRFVAKWASRFAAASGGSSGESSSMAASQMGKEPRQFTQADYDANPYLLSNVIRTMAADGKTRSETANALGTSMIRVMNDGQLPSNDTMMHYMQVSNDGQHDEKREEIVAKFAALSARNEGIETPEGTIKGTPAIQKFQEQADASGDIQLQKMGTFFGDALRQSREQLANDPLGYAASTMKIPRPAAIDWADPASIGQGIAQRGEIAAGLAAIEPSVKPSALFKGELDAANTIISSGTIDQKTALLGAIAGRPDAVRQATFDALRTGANGETFAQAGRIAVSGNIAAARKVLQGMSVLKEEPKFGPEDGDMFAAFQKELPSSDFPLPGARGRIMGAAKAYYAAAMFAKGDAKQGFDDALWKESLDAVTGGILKSRGMAVTAPRPGMSQAEFDSIVQSLTGADFAGAAVAGHPFEAASLRLPSPWIGYDRGARLRTLDPDAGRYTIVVGPAEAPQTIMTGDGVPFVLDLGARR